MTTLKKFQIESLKAAVEDWAGERGGACAHVKYHRQHRYAEGWLATFVKLDGEVRRDVRKVRAYATGNVYAYDERGHVVRSDYRDDVREVCERAEARSNPATAIKNNLAGLSAARDKAWSR